MHEPMILKNSEFGSVARLDVYGLEVVVSAKLEDDCPVGIGKDSTRRGQASPAEVRCQLDRARDRFPGRSDHSLLIQFVGVTAPMD
jgi:hypothetical protein